MFLNRDFTKLLLSRFISQLGDKIFIPAILWLALTMEGGSPERVGILALLMAIPPFLGAAIGVFVDRKSPKPLMISSDLIRFLLCLVLFFVPNFYVLAGIVFLIEVLGQFFGLASQTALLDVVEKDQLMKANSHMTAVENFTSIVGFAAGGALIAWAGSDILLLINGASFLVSGMLLIGVAIKPRVPAAAVGEKLSFWSDLVAGFRLVFKSKLMANLLLVALILNATSASITLLITVWSHDILHAGSTAYGILLSALLGGSLVGSLILNLRGFRQVEPQVLICGAITCFGIGIGGVSYLSNLYASLVLFAICGIAMAWTGIAFSTLLMKYVDRAQLAKMFGVINTVTRGAQPVGIFVVTSCLAFTSSALIMLWIGGIIVVGGLYLFLAIGRKKQIYNADIPML